MGDKSRKTWHWCALRAAASIVAIGVGLASCGPMDAVETEGVEAREGAVEGPGFSNPDFTIEQKYVPGIGYFDGTTCDRWPRDVSFTDPTGPTGVIDAVLNRDRAGKVIQDLKNLTARMKTMAIGRATAIGSKRELTVLMGTLTGGERTLLAVDASSRQGFMIDNTWLCTEADLQNFPGSCQLQDAVVGAGPFFVYKVLGKTTKAVGLPSGTAMLVAPQVRFAPPDATGEMVTNLNLIAVAQRVYGGGPYATGEDLSKRVTGRVNLKALPAISAPPTLPTRAQWRAALSTPRRPSLLALIGDEIGGFSQVTAYTPAPVEIVVVDYVFAEPAHYDAALYRLYVRPEEFFAPTWFNYGQLPNNPSCNLINTGFGSPYGAQSCDYSLILAAMPVIREAGGSGAVFVLGGTSPLTAATNAVSATPLRGAYTQTSLRSFIAGVVKPKMDPFGAHYMLSSLLPPFNVIDAVAWRDPTSTYQATALTTLTTALAALIDTTMPSKTPLFPALVGAPSPSFQSLLAANLLSRGLFADVLFARSELESLRSGVIAPTWKDAWRLTSDKAIHTSDITAFNAAADLGASLAKRTRTEQMARYLAIGEPSGVQSNVLGLSYGTRAGGWYALRSQGLSSLYAAEKRWSKLGSLVDSFQNAADLSTKLADKAQRDLLLAAVNELQTGLQRDLGNTVTAATALSSAAKLNASTQEAALADFQDGFNRLFQLSTSLQTQTGAIWGCSPSLGNCVSAATTKLNALQDACKTNGGLDWLKPLVSALGTYMPAIALADAGLQKLTGKGIVDDMVVVLNATSENAPDPSADVTTHVTALQSYEEEFAQVDQYLNSSAQASAAMMNAINQSSSTCAAGGAAQTNLNNFKTDLIVVDNMVQNYANQIRLVHAQIESVMGHIAYLTSQGQSYDTLAGAQTQLSTELDDKVRPLLTTLNTLANGGSYFQIAAQQRTFLDNACRTALTAARTGMADLHLISQALQTSTGRTTTKPYLVLPANPAYHFADGAAPVDQRRFDTTFDYAVSLWNDGAFSTRFTPDGTAATSNYMSLATTRFSQLMNTEVCEDGPINPASRFLVRKVITGQAFRTLMATGKVDFGITLEDIVMAGNASADVKAAVSRNFSSGAFDLPLGGAFVVSAGYSACRGTQVGKECCPTCRVPLITLSGAAAGKLNGLYVASRGQAYMPTAPQTGGACPAGLMPATATTLLALPNAVNYKVTSCLAPLVSPRASSSMTYFDDAAAPDNQVLNRHMLDNQCLVTAETLASRPLQGLPVLGTWALAGPTATASSGATAAALNLSMAPAPISTTALPAVAGATGVEVLFLVGTEAVETNEPSGYALTAQ